MADDDESDDSQSQLRIGGIIPVFLILVVLIVMYIRHKYLACRYPHKYPRPPPPPTPPPPPPRPPLPPIPDYERNNPFVYNDREWGASASSLNQPIDNTGLNISNDHINQFHLPVDNGSGARISTIDSPPPDFSSIEDINRQKNNEIKKVDSDTDLPKYEDLRFANSGGRRDYP